MAKGNQFRTVAIIARGRVISAPVIDGELVDNLLDINGAFTLDEASSLAKTLSKR
jgi:preprotein translocase subunit SecD